MKNNINIVTITTILKIEKNIEKNIEKYLKKNRNNLNLQ